METIIAPVVIAIIVVIAVKMIQSSRKKSVSSSMIAQNETQAKEIFFERMKKDFPNDFIKVERNAIGGYEVTIKTIKQ